MTLHQQLKAIYDWNIPVISHAAQVGSSNKLLVKT